jgi:V8-like Glu-specific endopeptidase
MQRARQGHLLLSLCLFAPLAASQGCAHEGAPAQEARTASEPPAAANAAATAAPATSPANTGEGASKSARKGFENPGGMWTPSQVVARAAELKSLGVEMDPAALGDTTAFPLGAVVSLGGCSASFVSADGLVITNHHCASRVLQYNSTPKENLLKVGYVAKTRADEKWNGPTSRVYVTQAFRDVTAEVRAGIEKVTGDEARYKKMEAQTKKIVAACEKGRPEVRCTVSAFFGGAQHVLIEQLEVRDIRLVYAPPEGVGNFGGEVDNWRWPRHDGDFTIYRAYVGKDGKPADHSPENVPYRPPHFLKIAKQPLRQGDFVMVAGYPGHTNRLRTAAEVSDAVSWRYPRSIKMLEDGVAALERLVQENPDRAVKVTPTIRGFNNGLTKIRGIQEGLVKGGLAAKKAKKEEELRAWIDADPARKTEYGGVLDKMAALRAEQRKTREQDATLSEAFAMSKLLSAASIIVRMAEERPKKDEDRDPELQARNWKRIEQEQTTLQKSYERAADRALLKQVLERAAKLPVAERSPLLALVVGKGDPTEAAIEKALDALWSGTKLEDEAARLALLRTAKTAELQKSQDPMIKLAVALRPLQKELEAREDALVGALALLTPRYIDALRKVGKGDLAPDANGTLRVTYGTVRGYRPEPSAPMHTPFTVLPEVVKKHTGKEPFDAPARVLEAVKAKRFGSYVDEKLGEVPVDFLSDLDITGGNSGSPTLNARGELVGLAFDGNYEAMASDWLFIPELTRTIHVDVRYILWILDAVEGADHIVKELGVTPSVN